MKLTNVFRYFLMAFALLGVFGCEDDNAADANLDEMFSTESVAVEQSKKEAMEVLGVKFSPDRKHFQVFTGMNKDIGPYAFRDSVVTIKRNHWTPVGKRQICTTIGFCEEYRG